MALQQVGPKKLTLPLKSEFITSVRHPGTPERDDQHRSKDGIGGEQFRQAISLNLRDGFATGGTYNAKLAIDK